MDDKVEDYQTQISVHLQAAYNDLYVINLIGEYIRGACWDKRKYLRKIAGPSPFSCACPSCGAANLFEIGDLEERCAHCRSELFPSNEKGLASARAARRHVHIWLVRAGRADYFRRIYDNHVGTAALIIIFLFLCNSVASSIHRLIGLFILAGVFGIFFFIRKKQQKLTLPFCRLVQGVLIKTPKAITSWLDRNWQGDYNNLYLTNRYRTFAIAGTTAGFPLLVWFDAMRFLSQPKIHIFLSAWVPGMSDIINDGTPLHSDQAEKIKLSLEAAGDGFIVQVQKSGILLQATPAMIREGIKNPQRFFNQLPDVLSLLTGLAEAYQCSPRED